MDTTKREEMVQKVKRQVAEEMEYRRNIVEIPLSVEAFFGVMFDTSDEVCKNKASHENH